ncbi:hypothetical protein PENSPDRAFT_758659 [Peniophora sp. CONT]|nr:hypothetical protein PENSPDRAFT_758659 [Peniophora sp. CONT]
MDDLYTSLEDIPGTSPLMAGYDAEMASLCHQPDVSKPIPSSVSTTGEIDRVVRTLELLLSDARMRRNATLPCISRLPPEVTATIFGYCTVEEPPHAPCDRKKKEEIIDANHIDVLTDIWAVRHVWKDALSDGTIGWIRLTHVCRRWRELLLGTATLWASTLGRLPSAYNEFLQRAGNHTLPSVTVISTPFHDRIPLTISLSTIVPICNRLRVLRLVEICGDPDFLLSLELLCTQRLEKLETLEITFHSSTFSRDSSNVAQWVLTAPSLRTIHFAGYFIPFKTASLEELSLNYWTDKCTLSMNTLYNLLQVAAPTLKYLDLSHVLSYNFDVEAHSLQEINLPQLQEFRFADGDGLQIAFLERAKFPPSVRLDIDIYVEISDRAESLGEHYTLKPLVNAMLSCGHLGSADGLAVYPGPDEGDLQFLLYTDSLESLRMSPVKGNPFYARDAKLNLLVSNGYSRNNSCLDVTFAEVSRFLRPARFAVMSFGAFPFWSHDQISTVLSQYTSLRTLHIVDPLEYVKTLSASIPNAFPFLSARNLTASSIHEHEDERDTDTVVPALELLWLTQNADSCRMDCTTWCSIISCQLRHTLSSEKPLDP